VATFIEQLKKKESVYFKKIGIKMYRLKKKKYTVLRSPFVNKAARDQFQIDNYTVVLCFTVVIKDTTLFFLPGFIETSLNRYLGSQFLEVSLVKCIFK
jgi:hypothetical protein